MFRGREMSHPERGRALLERLAEDVSELGVIESAPIQDGRNMVMLLAPVRELPPDQAGRERGARPKTRPAQSPPHERSRGPKAAKPEAAQAAAAKPEAPAKPQGRKAEGRSRRRRAAQPAAPEPEPEPTST